MKTCSLCVNEVSAKGLCKKHYNAAYCAANKARLNNYSKEYAKKNRVKVDAKIAEWREANLAHWKESKAKWSRENKEIVRASGRKYYAKNKKRIRAETDKDRAKAETAKWRKENPEKNKETKARWNRENPEAVKVLHSRRRAREIGADGAHTASEIKLLFTKQRGMCAACRSDIRGGYHEDHVIALARGGSNFISNIQLLCSFCNQSKNARDPIEFMQSRGYLL